MQENKKLMNPICFSESSSSMKFYILLIAIEKNNYNQKFSQSNLKSFFHEEQRNPILTDSEVL